MNASTSPRALDPEDPLHTAFATLLAETGGYQAGRPGRRVDLGRLDAEQRRVLAEILGEGEVSIAFADGLAMQEAVTPGVWRVSGRDGAPDGEHLEVADIPDAVRRAARAQAPAPTLPAAPPAGAMNVMPVLAEIAAAARDWRPGMPPLEINLSLLPMTPVDLAVLDQALGRGPVTILSRGYGNCRIQLLGVANAWRLLYFNSDDKMILDVIEVGDVPAAATAAQEDIDEAPARLRQIAEVYF